MSLGAFNYQTRESTLLGSVDQLRMRSDGNLYNYLPILSGVGSTGTPVEAEYVSGLSGFPGKMNSYLREINALNAALLRSKRRDYDDNDEKITIKEITNAKKFVNFQRFPGKREVGAVIQADVIFNRFKEGTFTDTNEDFPNNNPVQVIIPLDLAQRARDEYADPPLDSVFNMVRERGASMTDQEINIEAERMKRQAKITAEDNRRAEEQSPIQITPELREKQARDSAERRARNAVGLVQFENAAEKNKNASVKYKWGVDLSVYGGGPGDVTLARDAANFQKLSKLGADGVIGPKTLDAVKVIRQRMIAEGRSAKVPAEILSFVTALQIPGFADPRTSGAVTQEKFEKLKEEGVVKEQLKPSEAIAAYTTKYPDRAKAAGFEVPATPQTTPPATTPRKTGFRLPKPKPSPEKVAQETPDATTSAQNANIVSAKTLKWKTNPAIYPDGPGSAQLVNDIAFIQRKFGIGGASGVMTAGVLDRIKSQQLSGLGAVQADNSDTLSVASRLISGIVFPTFMANINWWYVGAGAVAIAALATALYVTSEDDKPAKTA